MRIIKEAGLLNSIIVCEFLTDMLQDYTKLNEMISVGTFTNCRECGYTFKTSNKKGKSFTWCVYEHRNSDSIIINGTNRYVSSSGDLPYNDGDKWDYLEEFKYNQHYECAEKLKELILEFLEYDEED